jgi:hypothetical protein
MTAVAPSDLNYDTVSDLLVAQLPALRSEYDELLKWWGDDKPGPHVVYGDLLIPFLEQAVRADDAATLATVFELVEVLAECSDARVRDIVNATICDFIVANEAVFARARLAMGPLTRRRCEEVARARVK